MHEVLLAKKALLLKRKELKWKLMEASQLQNKAKLDEIRMEVNFNKEKMIRIYTLAHKLRAKYLKVAKAAKLSESFCKKLEARLSCQEKFVAEEKMQLTKLAVDCREMGNQLYGPDYKLTLNTWADRSKEKQLYNDAISKLHTRKQVLCSRLSSLYDLNNSLLRGIASYRLTKNFNESGKQITDLTFAHNIRPHDYVCSLDLDGLCHNKDCPDQHSSNYIITDLDKIAEILSYKPSLTGFKPDAGLDTEANDGKCRLRVKEYAARLLSKNSHKSVEMIANDIVKYVRGTKSDTEILTMTRVLPKNCLFVT